MQLHFSNQKMSGRTIPTPTMTQAKLYQGVLYGMVVNEFKGIWGFQLPGFSKTGKEDTNNENDNLNFFPSCTYISVEMKWGAQFSLLCVSF